MGPQASPGERALEGCAGEPEIFQNSLLTWFCQRTYKPLPETMGPAEKQGDASKILGYRLKPTRFCVSFSTRENSPVSSLPRLLTGVDRSEEK